MNRSRNRAFRKEIRDTIRTEPAQRQQDRLDAAGSVPDPEPARPRKATKIRPSTRTPAKPVPLVLEERHEPDSQTPVDSFQDSFQSGDSEPEMPVAHPVETTGLSIRSELEALGAPVRSQSDLESIKAEAARNRRYTQLEQPKSKLMLTEKQKQVVRVMLRFYNERGVWPSMQDLADKIGLSKVTVHEHCQALKRKGVLEQPERSTVRGYAVTEQYRRQAKSRKVVFPVVGRIVAKPERWIPE